ncbi:zinc finger protein 320-like [Bolinopsis microptera]|uniref:zinc finger protein 320-like n=1 Tax=Bolinopsis microptera TaxID=2820187 RepID=UPI00307B0FD5
MSTKELVINHPDLRLNKQTISKQKSTNFCYVCLNCGLYSDRYDRMKSLELPVRKRKRYVHKKDEMEQEKDPQIVETQKIPAKDKFCNCELCQISHEGYPTRDSVGRLDGKYFCKECNFSTVWKVALSVHMTSHKKQRYFICDMCYSKAKVTGTTEDPKNQHIEYEDTSDSAEDKPFKCNECSYRAASRARLKMHLRIHTGERPFKCDQCNYSATQNGHLTTHKRTHTGERPYGCNLCSFRAILH